MQPSCEEIRRNAQRLWDDAKLLFDNERYPSAFALTVLSLEELGKYVLLTGRIQFGGADRNLRNHLTRQAAVFDLMVQERGVELANELLMERGIKIVRETEEIRAAMAEHYGEPSPERKAFVAQVWNEYLESVKRASPLYGAAQDGDLNFLKMASLYVDVREDGSAVSHHPKITRRVAEPLLVTAQKLLRWCDEEQQA